MHEVLLSLERPQSGHILEVAWRARHSPHMHIAWAELWVGPAHHLVLHHHRHLPWLVSHLRKVPHAWLPNAYHRLGRPRGGYRVRETSACAQVALSELGGNAL